MSFAWLNGEFADEQQAQVGLSDAGLLHAAGVFTTMRASAASVVRLEQHLRRVRSSCAVLHIPLRYNDEQLSGAAGQLLMKNALSEARLRLTVTRGQVVRDPLHGDNFRGNCFLTAEALAAYPPHFYERGLRVVLSSEQKLNPYDIQAGHKTLNYFSRLTALREAARQEAGESLWFNVHNFLQSGSISNVFIVEEDEGAPVLVTPPTNEDLQEEVVRRSCPYARSNTLPGIMRAALIEWAQREAIAVQRLPIDVNRLLAAREVLLTNSIMGVMPVTSIEQHVVGDGQPGRLTRRAMVAVSAG